MADINKFIPFIIAHEAGVKPQEDISAMFNQARKTGYANSPHDSGGPTMIGVTLKTYQTYCKHKGLPAPDIAKLKAIPFEHWRAICKELYWDRWQADDINSQSVAEMLVDWVWASGTPGITLPQGVLGVKQDGIVGPRTLQEVNGHHPLELFNRLKAEREAHFRRICAMRPKDLIHLRGWLNRLNDIKFIR